MERVTSPLSFEKRKYFLFIVFILTLSITPSRTDCGSSNNIGCVTNYDPNFDYFPCKVQPDYAHRFQVQYYNSYKVVNHISVGESYVLYQCGTPKPTLENASVKYFQIPLKNISVTETVILTFIEFLGVQNKIRFLDPTYVSSPCIQLLGKQGSYVPFSKNETIFHDQVNSVDGIFTSEFSPTYPPKDILQSASQELQPLQRAEWIKFISYFFNLEDQAETVFNGIYNRYNCHKNDQLDITNKPSMAWVAYYDNLWDVDTSDYQKKFVMDAGGRLVNSSDPIKSVIELYQFLSKIDFLIDLTYGPTYNMENFLKNYNITDDIIKIYQFPFLKNKQVWRSDKLQNPNGALDWFESAIVEVGLVLEELIHIMNPTYEPDHPMIWFRNIAIDEKIDISDSLDCKHNPNDVRSPRSDLCGGQPSSSTPFYVTLLVLLGVLVATGFGLLVVFRPCMKWSCLSKGDYIEVNN